MKSSKEHREQLARRETALQAEAATVVKSPPVMTGSAIDPAYLFTSLCPDPKRRKPPARKKVQHEAFR